MASYVRKNRISWPVIVDADRSFEQQCGVGSISLENIWRLRIITPDGRMIHGNPSDLEGAAQQALEGARWNVDPGDIPAGLQQAWLGVEFGNFATAAGSIKKSVKSRKPEVKAAAEKLHAYVRRKLDQQIQSADEALQAERKWEAYKAYSSIQETFKGYEIPAEVGPKLKELTLDETIKTELAALKRLMSAQQVLGSTRPSARKRALRILKTIVADSPETEAGSEAQSLLRIIEGSNGSSPT